jgi:hypothetical protein
VRALRVDIRGSTVFQPLYDIAEKRMAEASCREQGANGLRYSNRGDVDGIGIAGLPEEGRTSRSKVRHDLRRQHGTEARKGRRLDVPVESN